VQLKQDHGLTQSRPYRYVRQPVYTGFLLLFLGDAFRQGLGAGLCGSH